MTNSEKGPVSPVLSLSPEPDGSFLVNSATSLHLEKVVLKCPDCGSSDCVNYTDCLVCFACHKRFTHAFEDNELTLKKKADVGLQAVNLSDPLMKELFELGYPVESIKSMQRCGFLTGFNVLKQCGCGNKAIPLKHHCNLRTCPECSKIRKRKVLRKYMNPLKNLKVDNTNFIYMLTIAPPNYKDISPDSGKKDIQKAFAKFQRLKYVKDRIKGGLYVIETKGGEGNWNIHLHCLIYGRWMDNRRRGKCLDCGQSLLKYDKNNKSFYCGNSSCNSKNLVITEDSKITRLFQECSKNKARMHIQRQDTSLYSLNYMVKYISANKDEFNSVHDLAVYINATKDQRLISSFGMFRKMKIIKGILRCSKCGERIYYTFDIELNALFQTYIEELNNG